MANGFLSSISSIVDNARTAAADVTGGEKGSILNKALNILDPSKARLEVAGLLSGGKKKSPGFSSSTINAKFVDDTPDWRVKIRLGSMANYFYNDSDKGLLEPLNKTDGVIFPYTPSISVTHAARYGSQNLTHSNYTNYFYEGSEVQAITIAGEFTVQTVDEGKYLLACVYFFRAATKMFFGQGANVGHPPPMVFLNGYGSHYFPNVSCVVTSFQHTLPQDVDYISVPTDGGKQYYENDSKSSSNSNLYTRVPTNSTLSVTLQPIYTRQNQYNNFNLNDFAAGKLIKGKGGYI